MKKKGETTKAYEFLYPYLLNPAFDIWTRYVRWLYRLPKNGIGKEADDPIEWTDGMLDFIKEVKEIMRIYRIPMSMQELMYQYVLRGKEILDQKIIDQFCDIDLLSGIHSVPNPLDGGWKNGGVPYVKVRISDKASLEDAISFLKNEWKNIQELLDKQRKGRKKHKIRPRKNKDRDEFVYFLSTNLPDNIKSDTKQMSREAFICNEVLAKFGDDLDYGNIKKIISEQKKLRIENIGYVGYP